MSRYWARISRASTAPVTLEDAVELSVDLPWSMWAMIAMFLILVGSADATTPSYRPGVVTRSGRYRIRVWATRYHQSVESSSQKMECPDQPLLR